MKRSIESKADVDLLVKEFYKEALKNPVIGHFFTEVVQLDLHEHLPKIQNFWSDILLGSKLFKGNPMTKHLALNQLSPLHNEHFDEWLHLWEMTVLKYFEGEKANEAILRAKNIASLMKFKVQQ